MILFKYETKPPVGGGKWLWCHLDIHSTDAFKWQIHSETQHFDLGAVISKSDRVAQIDRTPAHNRQTLRSLIWADLSGP